MDVDDLAALCGLDDPTRRALYEFTMRQAAPVTRDAAAAAVGIDRSLAAYHLDQLVERGLLQVSFARPPGRSGPGAGRPAKHYAPSEVERGISAPPRDYRMAAEILVRAAERDGSGTVRAALAEAAREMGADLARDPEFAAAPEGDERLVQVLERHGYLPYDDEGTLRLRNCPFHHLAQRHTELVCAMNLAMLEGVAASAGADAADARLDPAPGRCCVAFGTPRDR